MPPQTDLERLLKPETIAALRAVTSGTCELTDPDSRFTSPEVITPAREFDSTTVERLKAMLLDAGSWFYCTKRCLPKPTAVVRLRSPDLPITLHLGLRCLDWSLIAGQDYRSSFFDPVGDEVRAIVKSIFSEYASPAKRSLWRAGAIDALRKQTLLPAGEGGRRPDEG